MNENGRRGSREVKSRLFRKFSYMVKEAKGPGVKGKDIRSLGSFLSSNPSVNPDNSVSKLFHMFIYIFIFCLDLVTIS